MRDAAALNIIPHMKCPHRFDDNGFVAFIPAGHRA